MEMLGIEQLMRNNTLNMEVVTLTLTLTLTVTLMGDDGHGPGHGTPRMCPLHHTRRLPESTFPWPWDPYAEYI